MNTRRTAVQTLVIAAAAFVVGLVVGGLGPRAEVRTLQDRVFELERDGRRGGGAAGRELARLITEGIDDEARPGARREGAIDPGAATPTDAGTDDAPYPDDPDDPPAIVVDDDPAAEAPDPIAAARETLAMRAVQARAALWEDARPTEAQEQAIDAAWADMNAELTTVAEELVDLVVAEGGEPGRRDMMRIGADTLDVLVEAEARVLDQLGPEQRRDVRAEATDPTAFVDPSVLDVLAELEGFEEPVE